MNDETFYEKLEEARTKIDALPEEDRVRLSALLDETKDRHSQIKSGMQRLRHALDDWRVHNRYLMFDLEATKREVTELRRKLEELEVRALFSGPHDEDNAFFSVHAGAGGNDACECTEFILRMYLRFFEQRGWKAEELTWVPGEEAGLRGATYRLSGDHVFASYLIRLKTHEDKLLPDYRRGDRAPKGLDKDGTSSPSHRLQCGRGLRR